MVKKKSIKLKILMIWKKWRKEKIGFLASLIGIYAYAVLSFSFLFYWSIVDKVGAGMAYSIDQLAPFVIAILFCLFFLKRKMLRTYKLLCVAHISSLTAIVFVTILVRVWVLGFYFFGEDPTTVLTSVTNNNKEYLVSIIRRGYPLSLYIISYIFFGTHTLFYGLITFVIYLVSAILLYIILYKFFSKKIIALMGTFLYITTPAYLDMFYWQGLAPGMIVALIMGLLTIIFLLLFQQTHKKQYYFASLLFFIATLKICFVRMIGFIIPLSFLTFFPLFSFKITIKKSLLYSGSFFLLWFLFFFIVFLIPYGVVQKILYAILPQLNTARETTVISVRGEPLNTQAYFVSFATLISYLFLPSEFAKSIFPFIKNSIFSFFSGAYNPSITFIFGGFMTFLLTILSILGIMKLTPRLKLILLFGIIFLISNLFYVPLFTVEYHNLVSLDAMFSMDSPGYGPGIRYVFVSSVGVSILLCLLMYIILNKSKKLFTLLSVFVVLVLFYGAFLNIENQIHSIKDMVPQRVVPDQIFQMVPKNGEKKILFSSNPVRNAIDAKIGGSLWLNAFYTFDELTYSNNLIDFMQKLSSQEYKKQNIFVFYNNPITLAFKDISQLVKNEIYAKEPLKSMMIIPSFTMHAQIVQFPQKNYQLIQRGEYDSPNLNQRFFFPRSISFTVQKQVQPSNSPFYDLYIFTNTSSKPNYPLSLWGFVKNGPIVSYADELDSKLSLPMENNMFLTSIPLDEKLQAVNILNKREKYRQEVSVDVSDIEQNNNVSKDALFDGLYTPKISPESGLFYRANTTPTTIAITLPEAVTLGRMLLNVPSGSQANIPTNIEITDMLSQRMLASMHNLTTQDWSPNSGSMFEIPLEVASTNSWKIEIKKTTHNPIMLDEIVLDPVEALSFTPQQLFRDRWASFHYVDNQNLLSILLENQEYNAMTLFYACAEDKDWAMQQKDMSEEIPGIWKKVQIPMHATFEETLNAAVDCNGSVLRKLIFVSPAYPGDFQINNVILSLKAR